MVQRTHSRCHDSRIDDICLYRFKSDQEAKVKLCRLVTGLILEEGVKLHSLLFPYMFVDCRLLTASITILVLLVALIVSFLRVKRYRILKSSNFYYFLNPSTGTFKIHFS